ncbi:hypothetical protein [Halostella salina]|uniref:hypothetical protein n=1 Tax=Halostella salina TaxID=1547897 RepID=UPI000EF797DE|nr:hypothetical protein [Halostella salina]
MPTNLPPGEAIDPEQEVGITPDGDHFHAMANDTNSYCGLQYKEAQESRGESIIYKVLPEVKVSAGHRWPCSRCMDLGGFRILDEDEIDYSAIFEKYDIV